MPIRSAKATDEDVIRIDTRNKWFNIVMISLCLVMLLGIRLQTNEPTTGDEPHYLIMDYSLVHEHTFNLKNVYTKDEYLGFYPVRGLPPQGNPKLDSLSSPAIYSPHGIGLPLLLFPGFAMAAQTGAMFEMVILATLVVCLTWWWTCIITKNRKIAYLAAGLLVICYFFNGLAGYIYPDMAVAAATLAGLIIIERYVEGIIPQTVFGLLLALLIFLHIKEIVIAVPLLLIFGYKLWRARRELPWVATGIMIASLVYYFITLHQWFGVWSPGEAYGAGVSFGGGVFSNVSAMLFDASRGLLVYNPIILLVFVGLPLWFCKSRRTLIVALLAVGPSIAMLADFNQWNGGEAEVGRYIVDFLPVLIPGIAFALQALRAPWQRLLIGILATVTLFISVDAAVSRFPIIDAGIYFTRPVLFSQIQTHTGLAIDHILPAYTTQTEVTILLSKYGALKLLACYALVVVLVGYGVILARHRLRISEKLAV